MRPVLIVPVPVPAYPYAVSAAVIMSQSGASGWTSWTIPSCYQTSLDRAGRKTTSSSPDQLYPDSRQREKHVSPHDSDKGTVFPGSSSTDAHVVWIALPVSRTRRTALEMPPCDISIFLDIALWDSPRPGNRTMSSRIPGGILAGMISTFCWNCNLCTATAHDWMYSIKNATYCLWSKQGTPHSSRTNWLGQDKIGGGGLSNFVKGWGAGLLKTAGALWWN